MLVLSLRVVPGLKLVLGLKLMLGLWVILVLMGDARLQRVHAVLSCFKACHAVWNHLV